MNAEPDNDNVVADESVRTATRLLIVGSAIVLGGTLALSIVDTARAALVLVPAAFVATGAVIWRRKGTTAAVSAAVMLVAALVTATLTFLDLVGVIAGLGDLETHGGVLGLVARIVAAGGGALMTAGALRLANAGGGVEPGSLDRPEQLALVGGLAVIGGWLLMLTSIWAVSADQALGIGAATSIVALVWLHSHDALPILPVSRRFLFLCLALITATMAIVSLVRVVPDLGAQIDLGGIWALISYLAYIGGAVALTVSGVLQLAAIRASPDGVHFNHVAGTAVVGIAALLIGLGAIGSDRVAPPPSDPLVMPTTETDTDDEPTDTTLPIGPEVSPVEACSLLTTAEVEMALGLAADEIDGILSTSGGEACVWQPLIDGEPLGEVYVVLGPGDAADFEEGAIRDAFGAGDPQSDAGGAALWFSGQGTGVLSVIEPADDAYALVEVEIASPDLDESTRLEEAKTLAGTAFARLAGEGPTPIEANLCDLVSDNDAETILAPLREGRAAAREELHVIGPSAPVDLTEPADTSCTKLILTEIYVEVAVGDPADFGAGAFLDGVPGAPVDGLGDEATWFAGVPVSGSFSAPHEAGVLAVRKGEARFRILLALPDIESAEQRALAEELASDALIRLVAGDAEIIVVDHPETDTSANGLVGNLVAKEQRGEWSRGEGLVATLQLILGEADPEDVLVHPDTETRETTGIVRLAYLYLEDGGDGAIVAELNRLLQRIFSTDDQLEQMAGNGQPTAALGGLFAAAELPEDCKAFFEGWQIPSGVGQCLQKRTLPGLDGYKVFGPAPPLPTAGWQNEHFDLALEALKETVPHYKTLGKVPEVNIVLSVVNDPKAAAVAAPHLPGSTDRPCGVALFTSMQPDKATDFKQVVAHELAHCLHGDTFAEEYSGGDEVTWWDEGMAEYLSNTVPEYAGNNLEHRDNLDKFNGTELATTVFDRSYDNFIFFQQLANSYLDQGLFNVIRSLPDRGGTRQEQEDAMAGFGGMRINYHTFVKNVSDVAVTDTGGGVIANAPDSDPYDLDRRLVIISDVQRFGAARLAVSVPAGKYACIAHDVGSDVELSWRSGRPGVPAGSWRSGLPDVMSGEAVIVASTTEPDGELTIEVKDVSDDDECEPEEDESETGGLCFDFCGISAYYRYPEALSDWVADLLPPLS